MSDADKKVRKDKKELSPEELEEGRKDILFAVNSGRNKKLMDKVAWILNHFPASRDSDITLSLRYWEQFQPEFLNGNMIQKENLFKLTKTNSLTRERARIQNDFGLYLASDGVRKHRGKLEEDQYETAISTQPSYPVSVIYGDESGKNRKFLIVGSLWILNGFETIRLQRLIEDWKKSSGIDYEFHFSEITRHKLSAYMALVDLLYDESALLGFKGMYVERDGAGGVDKNFEHLFYHLLLKGIEHEHRTKRAQLPRTVQFWKDQDSPGGDKLLLANLRDRLRQASKSLYQDKIHIDLIETMDSKKLIHIQLTDLFTGAINRKLNHTNEGKNHKDEFAEYFLAKFKIHGEKLDNGDATSLFSLG